LNPKKTISFGELLIRLRKAKLLTQEQVGDNSGISQKHMSDIENDKTIPHYDYIIAISNALEVRPSVLFNKLGEIADLDNGYDDFNHDENQQ
jgi:transcriptional regulator with XRE-family HTH domain